MNTEKFNHKLDKKRKEAGLSNGQLADSAGLCFSVYSNAINGKTNPHPRTKDAIARALGCDVADIFDGGE